MKTSISLLSALTALTSAARFTLHIPTTPSLNPSTLPPTTHATLQSHGAPITAPLTRANSFQFSNVAPGSYLATIHTRDYMFEPLRIDVSIEEAVEGSGEKKEVVQAWQTFWGNEWDNKGESRATGGNGVVVEVKGVRGKEFYVERQGFSPLSFLKSPMILMALFSLVMVVGMPKLLENMDPEMKAEFEEMQKGNSVSGAPNPAAALQNFDLASWMAGKTDTGGSTAKTQSPAANQNSEGKGRKRG